MIGAAFIQKETQRFVHRLGIGATDERGAAPLPAHQAAIRQAAQMVRECRARHSGTLMDVVDGQPRFARPYHMAEHGKPRLVAEHFQADSDFTERHEAGI